MFISTKSKFSDIICSKSNFGCNDHPWEDDGSIYIYTIVFLSGTLTVVYIYTDIQKRRLLLWNKANVNCRHTISEIILLNMTLLETITCIQFIP